MCDKLHNCNLPNESTCDLNLVGNKDVDMIAEYFYSARLQGFLNSMPSTWQATNVACQRMLLNTSLSGLSVSLTPSLSHMVCPNNSKFLHIIFTGKLWIEYRIYSCISRPFTTKKSTQKIALDLYTSHTKRPDQAIQEINITIA